MKKMKKIAICGASGVVGKEILYCLKALNFPTNAENITLFTSPRSAGKNISTPFGEKEFTEFSQEKAQDNDFIFLCVDGDFSIKYAEKLTAKGAVVIDSSSAFRRKQEIPLIIPEINGELVKNSPIISNPNCTTAILLMALYPIYKNFGLKKVIVSTYQATSGGGVEAMNELSEQTANYLEDKEVSHKNFAHPIPFNLIPHIDKFQENLYTKEEMKVVWESRKIMNLPDLKLSCTAVRIPTFRAHAEAVTIETEQEVSVEKIHTILAKADGVDLTDNPAENEYPMPLTATKKMNIEVGRIRKNDVFGEFGLDFFVCGDQLLRGAALNAVKIALKVIE
jgi:aspartate-semialdehyde dehydrogenase